jgi:hypothetical protein
MKITGISNDIGTNLASVISQHINLLQAAYSNALPQFDQLNNLQVLPKIQEQVSDSVSRLQNDSNTNSAKLIEAINQLNNSLTSVTALRKSRGANPKKPQSGFFSRLRNPALFFRRKRNTE